MLTHLIDLAALAAAPADPTLNTQAVITFLVSKIVPIILGGIGVLLLIGARKQRMSDVFETLMKVVIGGALLVGGTVLLKFGGGLVNVFFN
jgi:hypothetical protein